MRMLGIFFVVVCVMCMVAWADEQVASQETAPAIPSLEIGKYWDAEGVTSPADADPATVRDLTVDSCVQMALEENAKVKVAQDDVNAAKARAGQARAGLFPQITAQESFTHTDLEETSSGLVGQILGGGLSAKEDVRRESVVLKQTLFAGGQVVAAVKASKYLAQSQEWQRQSTLNQIAYDARQAYYDCLMAQSIVRVAKESVVTFERHLADTQQMMDVGLVSSFEVLRAKTEVGKRQSDFVAASNALRLALVNLRRIIGLEENVAIHLQPEANVVADVPGLDELLATAQVRRPEILALEKAIQASHQGVNRARGEYLPRVAGSVNYNHTDGGGALTPSGWTFTIGGELDIFAGGKHHYDVAEAKAQKSSLEHQKEDVSRLVELDVRRAHIQMQDALAQIVEEQGTVELAREGRRLAELRFQEGVGTQVEVLDAELALTNAESTLVQALRNYAVAQAALQRAIGKGGEDEESSGK